GSLAGQGCSPRLRAESRQGRCENRCVSRYTVGCGCAMARLQPAGWQAGRYLRPIAHLAQGPLDQRDTPDPCARRLRAAWRTPACVGAMPNGSLDIPLPMPTTFNARAVRTLSGAAPPSDNSQGACNDGTTRK